MDMVDGEPGAVVAKPSSTKKSCQERALSDSTLPSADAAAHTAEPGIAPSRSFRVPFHNVCPSLSIEPGRKSSPMLKLISQAAT
jgi:hypothetical protein